LFSPIISCPEPKEKIKGKFKRNCNELTRKKTTNLPFYFNRFPNPKGKGKGDKRKKGKGNRNERKRGEEMGMKDRRRDKGIGKKGIKEWGRRIEEEVKE